MIITNKHFMAEFLIRKILAKKIEHNFLAVGLGEEKKKHLIAQFCYWGCSVSFRVLYCTLSYVIGYSREDSCRGVEVYYSC